jgi:hypothetical protein
MKINVWKLSTVALACALVGVVASGRVQLAHADQPSMENARTKIQDAKSALQAAAEDKGGHRSKAIGFIGQALDEVNQGIEFAKNHK